MLYGLGVLELARWQFAMTTVFHFFFVPFSIGMGLTVAIMETLFVIKKDEVYKKMAKFWGKIFLLSFAVGVVTGIIQEFQFGMNWSNYSRFMGDIFGAPLAVEALLAFFMESTFIGIWMFTWDRFKPAAHVVLVWLTFLGSMLSAIWILAANAFMQHPTGFLLDPTSGRVKMADFGKIITNPQLWASFPHVIFGAIMTAGFVVVGMSAISLLKKRDTAFHQKSIRVGLWIGLVGAVLVMGAGDIQTRQIVTDQPMKFAATEGIYKDTSDPAPWKLISLIDTDKKEADKSIEIPAVLSVLTYHKLSGSVKGMDTINKEMHAKYDKKFGSDMNYYVPVKTLFWSFRVMVFGGMLCALLAIIGLFLTRKKKNTLENQRWFLWILGICTFLPFVLNSAGWFITEFGRYPWIVYGLYTIADAVSPSTTAGQLWFSNIMYFLIFTLLGGFMIYYSAKTNRKGPDAIDQIDSTDPLSGGAY